MGYTINWYLHRRVCLVDLEGSVSFDEARRIDECIKEFFEQGQSPVHLVVNSVRMTSYPYHVMQIKESSTYLGHPACGWVFVVTPPHSLVRFLANAVVQVRSRRLRLVSHVNEAFSTLPKLDHTLLTSV